MAVKFTCSISTPTFKLVFEVADKLANGILTTVVSQLDATVVLIVSTPPLTSVEITKYTHEITHLGYQRHDWNISRFICHFMQT